MKRLDVAFQTETCLKPLFALKTLEPLAAMNVSLVSVQVLFVAKFFAAHITCHLVGWVFLGLVALQRQLKAVDAWTHVAGVPLLTVAASLFSGRFHVAVQVCPRTAKITVVALNPEVLVDNLNMLFECHWIF